MTVVSSDESARLHGLGGGSRPEDANSTAAGAFARLMGATPVAVGARIANDGDASAAQMFERRVANAHERRQSALREDYTSGFGSPDGGLLDRTSIGARLAAGVDHAAVQPPGYGLAGAAGASEAVLARGADHNTNPANALRSLGGEQRSLIATPENVGTAVRNDRAPESAALETRALDSRISIEVTNSAVSGTAASGAVAGAGGQTAQNLAQQTAQVLASPRIAEVESLRAITSTQTAADSRSATTARRSPHSPSPGQRGTAGSSIQSSDKAESSVRAQFEQLVRSMRLNMGTRRSSARLRLHPPELGRIRIDVRIVDDRVRIGVQTETDRARELLSGRASHLKLALEQQGIHVDRFEVVTDTADPAAEDPVAEQGFGAPGDAERNQDRHGANAAGGQRPEEWEEDYVAITESSGGSQLAAVGDTRLDIRI